MGITIGLVGRDSDGTSVSGVDPGFQVLFPDFFMDKMLLMRALRGF